MLPKTYQKPETKCLAGFSYVRLMPLKIVFRILGLHRIWSGNADFVFLMKTQITRKKIYSELFFVNCVRAGTRSPFQYFIWLNNTKATSKVIFGS